MQGQKRSILFIAQTTFPVIFLDTPLRMAELSLVSAIVFDILAYFFKTPDRYMIDIMNSVIFLITGMLLSIFTANIKLNDFIFQKAIKTERDTDGLTGLLNKSSMMREIRKSMTNAPENGILVMIRTMIYSARQTMHCTGQKAAEKISFQYMSL